MITQYLLGRIDLIDILPWFPSSTVEEIFKEWLLHLLLGRARFLKIHRAFPNWYWYLLWTCWMRIVLGSSEAVSSSIRSYSVQRTSRSSQSRGARLIGNLRISFFSDYYQIWYLARSTLPSVRVSFHSHDNRSIAIVERLTGIVHHRNSSTLFLLTLSAPGKGSTHPFNFSSSNFHSILLKENSGLLF